MGSTTEDVLCPFPGGKGNVVFDLFVVLLCELAAKDRV
jgi:hypothetical protein